MKLLTVVFTLLVTNFAYAQTNGVNLIGCKPKANYSNSYNMEKDVIPVYQERVAAFEGTKDFALYLQTMMDVLTEQNRKFVQNASVMNCSINLNAQRAASEIFMESISILSNPDRLLAIDENGQFTKAVEVPKSTLDLARQMRMNTILSID